MRRYLSYWLILLPRTPLAGRAGQAMSRDPLAGPQADPGDSSLFGAMLGLSNLLGGAAQDGPGAEHALVLLRTLVDHLPVFVYAKDTESRFIMANDEVAHAMGAASARDLIGKTDADFFPPHKVIEFGEDERRVMGEGRPLISKDEPITTPAGETRWILTTKIPLRDGHGRVIGLVGIGKDITDRKLVEQERDSYIARLQEALASVRTLRGLLPICAHCNHIRDGEGHWQRVEQYVQKHTHAEFSHGVCPDCARKLYPEAARRFEAEQGGRP